MRCKLWVLKSYFMADSQHFPFSKMTHGDLAMESMRDICNTSQVCGIMASEKTSSGASYHQQLFHQWWLPPGCHETPWNHLPNVFFCVAPWNEGSRCQRDIAYVVKVKLKLPGRSYCGSRMLSTCRFPSHGTIGGFPLQKRMRRWEKPMALVRTKLHDNFHLTFWFWEKILRNGCFFCGSFWKLQLEKTLFSSQLESETWGRHDW